MGNSWCFWNGPEKVLEARVSQIHFSGFVCSSCPLHIGAMPLPLALLETAAQGKLPSLGCRGLLCLPLTSHLNVPSLLLLQCPAEEHAAQQEESHSQSGSSPASAVISSGYRNTMSPVTSLDMGTDTLVPGQSSCQPLVHIAVRATAPIGPRGQIPTPKGLI